MLNKFEYLFNSFSLYLARSLPLLLPAVEDGIFNDNWRIRQSSVELLGDLLFKVHQPRMCVSFLKSISL